MQGWQRSMRWPQTERAWVATSPNIPTFEAALVYPGIGIVGEAEVSEGRGTPTPFSLFGAPWLDAAAHGGAAECAWPSRREVREGDLHAALDPRRRRAPALRGHEPARRARRRHGCGAHRAARDRHARAGRDRSRSPVQGRRTPCSPTSRCCTPLPGRGACFACSPPAATAPPSSPPGKPRSRNSRRSVHSTCSIEWRANAGSTVPRIRAGPIHRA